MLVRLYGELIDIARVDRSCFLFTGLGGSLSSRVFQLSEYLANADEKLASSQALMAESMGITTDILERVVAAEAAQELPSEREEGSWMEGYRDDQGDL